jgi:hypothetical protein
MITSQSMSDMGPGSYNLGSAFDKRGTKFPNSSRSQNLKNDLPGPGAYGSPERHGYSPSYGFGNSQKLASLRSSPGPGEYELKSTLARNGGVFGSKRDLRIDSEVPGPGSYSIFNG